MEECRFYIDRLRVPEGMTTEVLQVENPKSMTTGYQEAMVSSDAKYKVYLHQDMLLVHRDFLSDLLACFQEDPALGMVGVAGAEHLANADAWRSLDIGGCYSVGTFRGLGSIAVRPEIRNPQGRYQEVDFIDGMLLATAADLPWDERIEGFHFYDVSQCERFKRNGYKIAVARQEQLWSFHDFGPLNLATYRENQIRFCELYGYRPDPGEDDTQLYRMCDTIAAAVKDRLNSSDLAATEQILKEVDNAIYFNQTLLTSFFLMEIYKLEQQNGETSLLREALMTEGFPAVETKWLKLRLRLIRTIFGYETAEQIAEGIHAGDYSAFAVIVAAFHNIPQEDQDVLDAIGSELNKKGILVSEEWEHKIMLVREYEHTYMPSADEL
jgi:hypothetical protein